jgi:adenine deaminase
MLCSDDIHPEMLVTRHLDKLIAKLIQDGYNLYDVIRSCTVNPVLHYGLEAGLLKVGQSADFVLVDDYRTMNVLETWINGIRVFDRGSVLFEYKGSKLINKFNCSELRTSDIEVVRKGEQMVVIEVTDGELLTGKSIRATGNDKFVGINIADDILKIVVKDRYNDKAPAIGFIRGFGLKNGAFASSVAHDSHNIICVGTNDDDIVKAINTIVLQKGGLAVSSEGNVSSLKLNIAGIMSDHSCEEIAIGYESLSGKVKEMGSRLNAPFMTLSFMALLVIPELKIGDRGLFDVNEFKLISLFVQ